MRSNQNEIIFFYNFIAFVFLRDRQHLDTVAADLVLDHFPHKIYPEPKHAIRSGIRLMGRFGTIIVKKILIVFLNDFFASYG